MSRIDPAVFQEAIKLVEAGQAQTFACKALGLHLATLNGHIRKHRPDLMGRRLIAKPAEQCGTAPKRPARCAPIRPLKDGRGIDVAACCADIRRIVLKHFRVASVEPDDLVQAVALRILEQNALPCAWDPARSSFSHYVYLVGSNVASKLARREGKQGEIEAAMREELLAASGQRTKIGSETTMGLAPFEVPNAWGGSINGTVSMGDHQQCWQ